MNDKIVEFISGLDFHSYDEFNNMVSIESSIDLDGEIENYDFSWINEVEKYLPFITNIVNYDYSNIKVLVTYENRFIKTLIYRLYDFLNSEYKKFNKINFSSNSKTVKSKVKTTINNEIVEVDIKISSILKEDLKKGESYGLSLKERIERVLELTLALFETEFMKQLNSESFVHSPVTKTEVFEEELNYRKCLELFNFIENYNSSIKKLDINLVKNKLENNLLMTSYIEYLQLKNCNKEDTDENVYRLFLERIIEKMVMESSMDEKSFKKMITKKFDDEYTKKKNREKNIQNIFIKSIDNYNKQIKDALRALKN